MVKGGHVTLGYFRDEERTRAAVSHEEAAMTMERIPLDRVDDLIATGELVDAKSIIGLLLARRFLAER